jgi:S1-C subfamily serine protease
MKGEVVRINTAIFSRDRMARDAGISFTIPISMARWVADGLLATGHSTSEWCRRPLALTVSRPRPVRDASVVSAGPQSTPVCVAA